jgi:anti-sigma factor RsiW
MTTHAGDELSALIDGELDAEQARIVREHIATCPECAAELDAVRFGRSMVRLLPAVDPPPRFLDDVIPALASHQFQKKRTRGVVVVQFLAVAVIALLVVAGYDREETEVVPEVAASVEQHASTAQAMSVGMGSGFDDLVAGSVTPSTTPPQRPEQLPEPFVAPRELAGYTLVGGFLIEGGVQLLYENGEHSISLFEKPGELDYDQLPAQGHRVDVDGKDAWIWDRDHADGRVLVVQSDDLVVTLVGDNHTDVKAAAAALPGTPSTTPLDRLRQACADALSQLGPAPD